MEDLLKPRYKVIADYPKSIYKVGTIINAGMTSEDLLYCDWEGPRMRDYPHLFRKMDWWKDRKLEEMPQYLRCIKTPDQKHFPNEVYKVEWKGATWARSEKGLCVVNTNCYLPATLSEYLNQNKK